MYLQDLTIRHLKRLGGDQPFRLSFVDEKTKQPRMWTVLIGENGTAKTSILQAVALAAAGRAQVNTLAQRVRGHLRDRRSDSDLQIECTFRFSDLGRRRDWHFFAGRIPPTLRVHSWVKLRKDEKNLDAGSTYEHAPDANGDPLDRARSRDVPHWFVAGYGIDRTLPHVEEAMQLTQPSIDRLIPLFKPIQLPSLSFIDYFREHGREEPKNVQAKGGPNKARMFSRTVKKALVSTAELLPRIEDIEIGGRGGVDRAGALLESNRFIQDLGTKTLKIPANALSHGYQSTIAWVTDLVGHIVLEAQTELKPEEMEGLVLIDELDLYLHPTWQVVLVRALRRTFPKIQFIATTHSPLVLADLDPGEVIRLKEDPATGDIVRAEEPVPDPRIMTATELLRYYFNVDDVYPERELQPLRDYRALAANPYRTAADNHRLVELKRQLDKLQVDPHFEPVPQERDQ